MTMSTLTFRAAKHRSIFYGIFIFTMIMTLVVVTQTQSRSRRAEEDLMRCQQKHDAVAAQYTVLYEQKTRLQKSLQAEVERKKAVDEELKLLQSALSKEKINQAERYSKLMRQFEELKTQQLEENTKLKATYDTIRQEKEKLDSETSDLNTQNANLKEANQKLEEEIHKMQQNLPVDMSEVDKLKERLKTCESQRPEASEVNGGGILAAPKSGTVTEPQREAEKPQENEPVLPIPQQPIGKVSSTTRPTQNDGILVEPRPVPEDLNVRPVAQLSEENPKASYLGHKFGDNIDRKELPSFKKTGDERDYPDNGVKDDDVQGADDGEDGQNKEENKFFNQEDNIVPNEDFDQDPNQANKA